MKKEKQNPFENSNQQTNNSLEFSPRVLEILETLEEVFDKIDTSKSTSEKELVCC
ncbi:hypothetical protein MNBD_PLANCTO02-2842 [hydrothermal vent metagenome]|uniref:Uncharacterized protein n=1 Tax=hydrothermal vent metagenome TaxID=652676 RepID=A0A3B1DNA6_9ZZZZ